MWRDSFPHNHKNDQQESDYAPGQYPAYLMPDGTWRYGVNAKKIADAAWANRHRAGTTGVDYDITPHCHVEH